MRIIWQNKAKLNNVNIFFKVDNKPKTLLSTTNTQNDTLERAQREKYSTSGFPDENITYKNTYWE